MGRSKGGLGGFLPLLQVTNWLDFSKVLRLQCRGEGLGGTIHAHSSAPSHPGSGFSPTRY